MPMPSEPFARKNPPSKAEIQEILTNWIVEMQFSPNEKISDVEIASYFKVSRTPIREVLQVLEGKKLICTYPGRATVVAGLGTEKLEQLYRPMQTLQCLAVRLAVEKATAQQIAELEQLNGMFEGALRKGESVQTLLNADKKFHRKIMDIAGNEYIVDFCNTLWAHIGRLEYLFFEESTNLEASCQDHRLMIEGIRMRDPFNAELAMKNNWNTSMLEVLGKIELEAAGQEGTEDNYLIGSEQNALWGTEMV